MTSPMEVLLNHEAHACSGTAGFEKKALTRLFARHTAPALTLTRCFKHKNAVVALAGKCSGAAMRAPKPDVCGMQFPARRAEGCPGTAEAMPLTLSVQ